MGNIAAISLRFVESQTRAHTHVHRHTTTKKLDQFLENYVNVSMRRVTLL